MKGKKYKILTAVVITSAVLIFWLFYYVSRITDIKNSRNAAETGAYNSTSVDHTVDYEDDNDFVLSSPEIGGEFTLTSKKQDAESRDEIGGSDISELSDKDTNPNVYSGNKIVIGDLCSKSDNSDRLKLYLGKIRAISDLLLQFIQRSDYIYALNILSDGFYPDAIRKLMGDLFEYREKYIISDKNVIPIAAEDKAHKMHYVWDILKHFVKIEKMSNQEERKLYAEILSNLHILTDYFYSEDFFRLVMNNG